LRAHRGSEAVGRAIEAAGREAACRVCTGIGAPCPLAVFSLSVRRATNNAA